ncbi:NAD-dependent epimerase/dehydratase family protein [Desulfohalovibrio reitneri]|uniref:NAD-dependent epimerase/dehydratase family protein n=1 Tax=Desulfohalovibrio reitneri TaxID=1307759 RepID=UPI0004A74897|nr:NAD(P)-dependent oxidoreductase [Desulfohalovibrio reitneri]
MRRVLVTGATGFIGYRVAELLAEEGLTPRLMVRRMPRGTIVSHLRAEPVMGDLRSPDSLRRAVEGCDTVLHLGARASFEPYDTLKPSLIDGSRELARVAAEAGVECLVFAGSLLVYGQVERGGVPIDASTPPAPASDYGKAKLHAEMEMAKVCRNAGMAFASLRLPHVYGARDAVFSAIREGGFIMPGDGENAYGHLHVEDAARQLIETARKRLSVISPCADDRSATWNEFFAQVRRYYPRLRLRKVPRGLAMAGAGCLAAWSRLRGRQSLETPDGVRSFTLSLPVAEGLLWEELGLQPRYPTLYQGVPAVLDDCVSYRWMHPLEDNQG